MAETCKCCGKEMVDGCNVPGCKAHVDVYSRVVGYMRPTSTWNAGKQQEFAERAEYESWKGAKIAQVVDYTGEKPE